MGYDYHWIKDAPAEAEEPLKQARALYHQALKERDDLPEGEKGRWAPDMPEGIAGGSARWREAWKRVMATSEQVDRANLDYFQLNIWGGGRYADAMRRLGMARSCAEPGRADWDAVRRPEDMDIMPEGADFHEAVDLLRRYADESGVLPQPLPESLSEYDRASWYWLMDPDNTTAARDYMTDIDALLSRAPDTDSMWMHKIAGSNDGWINTPDEIRSALATYAVRDETEIKEALHAAGIEDRDYWDRWIAFLRGAAEQGGGFMTN